MAAARFFIEYPSLTPSSTNPTTAIETIGSSTFLPEARVEAEWPERAAYPLYPQRNTSNLTPQQHLDTPNRHARWVGVEFE